MNENTEASFITSVFDQIGGNGFGTYSKWTTNVANAWILWGELGLFKAYVYNNFTEVNILLGLMIFWFKRLPGASIKTLQQNLTSYKFFFSMNLAQASINGGRGRNGAPDS